jgi:hypothetical protein
MGAAKPVLAAAALAIVLGVLVAAVVPGGGHIVAVAAAFCGFATWLLPLLGAASWRYAERRHRPRKLPSLAVVGHVIVIVVLAAMPTVAGILLAFIALVSAEGASWAWSGLATIAIFWVSVAIGGHFVSRGSNPSKPRSR